MSGNINNEKNSNINNHLQPLQPFTTTTTTTTTNNNNNNNNNKKNIRG